MKRQLLVALFVGGLSMPFAIGCDDKDSKTTTDKKVSEKKTTVDDEGGKKVEKKETTEKDVDN